MRISDWSSDVCSSDLLGEELGALVGADHVGQADRRVLVGRRAVARLAEDGNRRGVDHPLDALAQCRCHQAAGSLDVGADQEIGRASCRERVCQYVWLSVVAGELKKKTTKK